MYTSAKPFLPKFNCCSNFPITSLKVMTSSMDNVSKSSDDMHYFTRVSKWELSNRLYIVKFYLLSIFLKLLRLGPLCLAEWEISVISMDRLCT